MALSARHLEIRDIQEGQIRCKEKELRFIAKNLEAMIDMLWEKRALSLVGYEDRDALSLWRGQSIDYDTKHTNNPTTIYHRLEQMLKEERWPY